MQTEDGSRAATNNTRTNKLLIPKLQSKDTCGYDMKKSLEKLLDQAFDKSPADVHDSSEKFADMKTKSEAPASEKRSQDLNCNRGLKFQLLVFNFTNK
ncbi:hypothetical protein P8452_35953 [Trifolium repens]|nr:hypothetical protein P8452_35953 [Trifolium repens]